VSSVILPLLLPTFPPNRTLIVIVVLRQAFVITHPDQARSLLVAHPQLAYALFQALLLNKIVDPAILQVSCLNWSRLTPSHLHLAHACSN
jgi:cleavage stimulation factor subunit 2